MEKLDSAMHKAAVLTEALPYIQDFCGSTVLVKVGGSVMESDDIMSKAEQSSGKSIIVSIVFKSISFASFNT